MGHLAILGMGLLVAVVLVGLSVPFQMQEEYKRLQEQVINVPLSNVNEVVCLRLRNEDYEEMLDVLDWFKENACCTVCEACDANKDDNGEICLPFKWDVFSVLDEQWVPVKF